MTKVHFCIALFIFALASLCMQASEAKNVTSPDTILARGSDNYPPFEFVNDKGEPDGFNVEVFRAVMRTANLNYEIKLGDWDEVIDDVNHNRADALVGMIFSKERAREVSFCVPHCTVNRNIIYRKDKPFETIESIRGKEIIVQKGGWSDNYVTDHKLTDKIVVVEDMVQALKLLSNGQHDVAIGSDLVALSAIKQGSYSNLEIHPMGIEPQTYSIVVNKENEELLRLINLGLQELKLSGEYDQIYNKWFGVYSGNTEISQKYYQMLFIGLGIIAFLVLVAYALRVQVRRATRKLITLNHHLEATLQNREEVTLALKMAIDAASLQALYYDVKEKSYFKMENDGYVLVNGYLLERIYEKDRSAYMTIIDHLITGKKDTASRTFRFKKEASDKLDFYEICFIAIKDRSNNTYRIVINLRDITQRYTRQLKIESARRSLEMAIGVLQVTAWEYDLNTHEYSVLYGDSFHDVPFDEFYNLLHPDDRTAYRKFVKAVAAGEKEMDTIVSRILTRDTDRYAYLECNIASMKNNEGENVGLIGSFRDISEQKNYESKIIEKQHELEIAKENAERSDRLKSAFLANMSHEIRTPLNAIVGFSELIIATDDNEEKDEYCRLVTKNNDLLLKLINDILDLSKIESGYMDFSMERLNFAQFFEDVSAIIRPHVPENIEFICERPYEKCILDFDKDKAMQVFNNLLTNAIKFTKRGTIRMGYECNESGLTFYVADTGIGIAQEDIPKIFTRFEKIDTFTQGTGLGMAICKAIVDSLSGRIDVESQVGQGTTVRVWMPCQPEVIEMGS